MKKFQKNIVSSLVVLLLFVTMPFVVYASENDYDVYLKVTYADGTFQHMMQLGTGGKQMVKLLIFTQIIFL